MILLNYLQKEDINPLIKKVEIILDSNTHSDEMTLISKKTNKFS